MKGLRLSQKEIDSILDYLEAESPDDHPARKSQRVPVRNHILIIYRGTEQEPMMVSGKDISRHGLSFLFAQYMTPGESIRVVMLDREKGVGIKIHATVVRCKYITKMIHEVGVKFKTPLHHNPAETEELCSTREKYAYEFEQEYEYENDHSPSASD